MICENDQTGCKPEGCTLQESQTPIDQPSPLDTERGSQSTPAWGASYHPQQLQGIVTLGTLAAEIVHELSNMVTISLQATEMALETAPPGSKTLEFLQLSHTASTRAGEILRQFLDLSRKPPEAHQTVRLWPIISEALRLIDAVLPATIEIRQQNLALADTVLGKSAPLNQMVMNLCLNAVQAMHSTGGVLSVQLAERQAPERPTLAAPTFVSSSGPHLCLTVSDTGSGMTPEIAAHIFEAFFTTKSEGRGLGLGLMVVQNVIAEHHGALQVTSRPGEGTTFDVFLPLAQRV